MGWSRILVLLLWPVWNHSTTSFWRLSYIERVLLSPNTFSGLKLSHMRLLLAFTSPLAGWGGRVGGVGWKGREREGDRGAYQISSRYLNPRLRYNYFRFGRTNSRHIGIPPCRFWPGRSNLRAILNQVAKFRPNRTTYGGVMTSYTISKWRPRQLHTISGLYIMMSLSLNFWRSTFIDIYVSMYET